MSFFQYRVYGLSLVSDTPLPELNPGYDNIDPKSPEVRVKYLGRHESLPSSPHWLPLWTLPSGEPWLSCAKYEGGYLLRFPNLADFSVDDEGEIIRVAASETPADTLRHLLLDQVLPLVLNLKGCESLHATAVLTPMGVCAFAGPTGVGKSTLAASFLQAGYAVLSDDCLVLKEEGAQILALPAYPGLRLWEDTIEALSEDLYRFFPVAHYTSKKRLVPLRHSDTFLLDPHPLARIYFLVQRNETEKESRFVHPVIERLSCRDGFMELIQFAFRLDVRDRAMLLRQFHFVEEVITRVPVRRLRIPNAFSSLPAVRQAIFSDLENG